MMVSASGDNPDRILIVLPTWVGDFVMATPALRAIRRRFSASHISFLAPRNLDDLVRGGDWMDEVILWDKRRSESVLAMARQLRGKGYQAAVLLSNSFRSAFLVWAARIPRRIGYARDGRSWLLTDRLHPRRANGRLVPHPMVEYYGAIAERLGCSPPGDSLELFTTAEDEAVVEARLGEFGISPESPLIVVSPGASFGASKLWLPERFAQVCDRLVVEHGAAALITCGPGEELLAQTIGKQMQQAHVVFDSPRLTLGQLKSLIRRCQLLICNDIGPRHFAKAFGVPVVTVFGSTDPAWTDTDYAMERKVRIEVECGPCQKKICPLTHHQCMTGVTVDMVYEACQELLSAARGHRMNLPLVK